MIRWDASKEEYEKAAKIANRAIKLGGKDCQDDLADIEMDIIATHLNNCPLDLDKLLAADDVNFGHDVFGISRHLNRNTGKLLNAFCPRCAA